MKLGILNAGFYLKKLKDIYKYIFIYIYKDMTEIDYKKMYEEILFDKIVIQKEFEKFKITHTDIVDKLNKVNDDLKEHLKKYTAPERNKKYYEKNKEKIIEKIKANKPTPEKIKEYNKKSYQNRKLKQLHECNSSNKEIENI